MKGGLVWPTPGLPPLFLPRRESRLSTKPVLTASPDGVIERVEAVGTADSLPFKRTPQGGSRCGLPDGLAGSPAVVVKIRDAGVG